MNYEYYVQLLSEGGSPKERMYTLNTLGRDGWELVSTTLNAISGTRIEDAMPDGVLCFFKRPKT